jgi:hypothetical protein
MSDQKNEKPTYTHPAIFRCSVCRAEYQPQCKEWENASKELWSLGWTLCQRKDSVGHWSARYSLHCAECIPIEVKNASAFVQA